MSTFPDPRQPEILSDESHPKDSEPANLLPEAKGLDEAEFFDDELDLSDLDAAAGELGAQLQNDAEHLASVYPSGTRPHWMASLQEENFVFQAGRGPDEYSADTFGEESPASIAKVAIARKSKKNRRWRQIAPLQIGTLMGICSLLAIGWLFATGPFQTDRIARSSSPEIGAASINGSNAESKSNSNTRIGSGISLATSGNLPFDRAKPIGTLEQAIETNSVVVADPSYVDQSAKSVESVDASLANAPTPVPEPIAALETEHFEPASTAAESTAPESTRPEVTRIVATDSTSNNWFETIWGGEVTTATTLRYSTDPNKRIALETYLGPEKSAIVKAPLVPGWRWTSRQSTPALNSAPVPARRFVQSLPYFANQVEIEGLLDLQNHQTQEIEIAF